jgi:hypothetical protein
MVILAPVLLVLALFRSGLRFDLIPSIDAELANFPEPSGTLISTSYGLRTFFWITGVRADAQVQQASLLFTLVVLAASLVFISFISDGIRRRILLAIWLLGPVATVFFGNVGRNDALLLAGSLLIAVIADRGLRPTWVLCGVLLMSLANPEQALVATIILLLVSFSSKLRSLTPYAMWSLGGALTYFLTVSVWAGLNGTSTRTELLSDFWRSGISFFGNNLPLVIFSGYGVLWLVVGAWILGSTRSRDIGLLSIALIVIPVITTAITADQTRVWVGVTTLAITALVLSSLSKEFLAHWITGHEARLTYGLAFLLLIPAVEVTHLGSPRVPWEWVFGYAQSLIIPSGL